MEFKTYLEYTDIKEAEKVLQLENEKQGFPLKGCVTLTAFEIETTKEGKFLIDKEVVSTDKYDKKKSVEKQLDKRDVIDLPIEKIKPIKK